MRNFAPKILKKLLKKDQNRDFYHWSKNKIRTKE